MQQQPQLATSMSQVFRVSHSQRQAYRKALQIHGALSSFMYIINYLRIHRPRVFILENVGGLLSAKYADTFQNIMAELRSITGSDGRSHYLVSYRLVNTADWGLPHHRQRVYIVGLRRDTIDTTAPLAWPGRSRAQTPIDNLLDDARPVKATRSAAPCVTSKTEIRLQSYLNSLRTKGHNPDKEQWSVNIFGHRFMTCSG